MSDSIDLGLLTYLQSVDGEDLSPIHFPTGLPLPGAYGGSICQWLCEFFNKDRQGLKFNDDIRAPFELREQPARGTAPNGRGRARGIPPWPQIAPYAPGAPCPCIAPEDDVRPEFDGQDPLPPSPEDIRRSLPGYLRNIEQWWPDDDGNPLTPFYRRIAESPLFPEISPLPFYRPAEDFCENLERRIILRSMLLFRRYLELLKKIREDDAQGRSHKENARRLLLLLKQMQEHYLVTWDIFDGVEGNGICDFMGKVIAKMMQNCNELGYDFTNCKWDEGGLVHDAPEWLRNRGLPPLPPDIAFAAGFMGHPDFYPP